MRTFEQTHSWLSFEFRADRLPHIAWMLIGEARRSECEHINDAPPERCVDEVRVCTPEPRGAHPVVAVRQCMRQQFFLMQRRSSPRSS